MNSERINDRNSTLDTRYPALALFESVVGARPAGKKAGETAGKEACATTRSGCQRG